MAGGVDQSLSKDAAGYYIRAAESGGESPGRWWGPGAEALGFKNGETAERIPYDLLFSERKAPDAMQVGRAPGNSRKAADTYVRLLVTEPHATAERKRELRLQAVRQTRQSPLFFDLTLSVSKSISIFHASLGENAWLAREASDAAGQEYWSGLVAEVDEMIYADVHAGFEHFQQEAGYTRTGSHNTRVNKPGERPAARGGPGQQDRPGPRRQDVDGAILDVDTGTWTAFLSTLRYPTIAKARHVSFHREWCRASALVIVERSRRP